MLWPESLELPGNYLLKLGVTLCCFLWLKVLVTACYNLLLHPLQPVPGPILAKLLPQYMSPAMIKGHRAQSLLKLHEEYGPLVRVSPNEVSIGDFQLYRQIYSQNTSTKEESFYKAATLLGLDNISNIRNKAMHSARRKMMSQPFSQRAINENEPFILELANRLIQRVTSDSVASSTRTTDVLPFCKLFGFEVICRAAFNKDISTPSTEHALKFLQAMEDSPTVLIISSIFPFLRKWKLGEYLPGSIGHAFRQYKLYEQWTRALFQEFRQKFQADSTERFIATPLLQNEDTYLGRKLSEDEAVEEAMGLAFAGSGTTSVTLIYLLYNLSRPENRQVQLRLRDELSTKSNCLAEIKDLPYLNAVIKETMRLHPTIISTLPRTLSVPLFADGIQLPAGTVVGMQNYVHHRSQSVYSEPHAFIPERWIGQSQSGDMEKAFTPYSLGPRNCIGQNLAKAELLLATSQICRRLDLRLSVAMKEGDMEMEDHFAALPKGRRLLLDICELR